MNRYFVTALSLPLATTASAQQRNPDFQWSKALGSNKDISLHNVAGHLSVKPSTTGKVEILGFKHGRGDLNRLHAEVQETSRGLVVCVVDDDTEWTCDERGMSTHSNRRGRDDWDRGAMAHTTQRDHHDRFVQLGLTPNEYFALAAGVAQPQAMIADVFEGLTES